MPTCSCKKTNCENNRCKCKKSKSFCSSDCLCQSEKCKNQKVVVKDKGEGEVEDTEEREVENDTGRKVESFTWKHVEKMYLDDLALIRKLNTTSQEIPKTFKMKLLSTRTEMEGLLQMMEQVNIKQEYEVLPEAEWEDFKSSLLPCEVCGRKFRRNRHEKHESICKRKTMNLDLPIV